MITYETILHGIKWDAVTDHLKTTARPGLSQVSDRTSVLEVLSHHGCNITHKALTLRVTYEHSKPGHKVTHPCHGLQCTAPMQTAQEPRKRNSHSSLFHFPVDVN